MEFIPTLQTEYFASIINTSQLILYGVIISVYCEKYTRYKHKAQTYFTLQHLGTKQQPYVSKVRVKAASLHAEQAEGGGRGTALPTLDLGASKGWVASATKPIATHHPPRRFKVLTANTSTLVQIRYSFHQMCCHFHLKLLYSQLPDEHTVT